MFGCSGLQTLLYEWRAATTRNTFYVCIRRLPNHTFSVWILLFLLLNFIFLLYFLLNPAILPFFFFSNPDPTHILSRVSCLDIEKDTNIPAHILSEFVPWILRKTNLHAIGFMLTVLNITINDYIICLEWVFSLPKRNCSLWFWTGLNILIPTLLQ